RSCEACWSPVDGARVPMVSILPQAGPPSGMRRWPGCRSGRALCALPGLDRGLCIGQPFARVAIAELAAELDRVFHERRRKLGEIDALLLVAPPGFPRRLHPLAGGKR